MNFREKGFLFLEESKNDNLTFLAQLFICFQTNYIKLILSIYIASDYVNFSVVECWPPSLRRWADAEMYLLAKRLLRDSPNVRTNFWWKVWFVKKESPKPNLDLSLSKDLRGYAFLSSHNKLLYALLCISQQPHLVWLETHKLINMEPG